MSEKLIKKTELNEDALEKVSGGFFAMSGREIDPNGSCSNYVCSICGGKRFAHLANCSHSRLDCCGSCLYVKRNNGVWSCETSNK